MADQKINELPTKTAPSTGDKMLMIGTAEEYQIDYDQLATAILNKLSTQSFSSLDTTSKTVLGAIDELNSKSYLLDGGIPIPESADMNSDTYKTPGNYFCSSSTIANSLKNVPFSNTAFTLKVGYSTGKSYPSQTFKAYRTGKVAYRIYDAYSQGWSDWFFFSDDATVLNGRGNIIKASNTVSSVYGEVFDVCSVELTQNSDYLVIGSTQCGTSINEQMSCTLALASGQGASFFGLTDARTIGQNGGGVVNAALVSTTNQKATVKLNSYGYSDQTYNISGHLFAIKLK